MNMKGVVLGVAGALAVTGVQAADLAVAPEPVDYVRVCDAFGTGFLYVPGTETCFQIRGRVRADYRFAIIGRPIAGVDWNRGKANGYNFRARAYFYSDSRTNTEYGLLRTYAQLEIQTQTSAPGSAVNLDQAFIQFGGLTFGKAYSFFDFYQTPGFFAPFEPAHSDQNTLMAAYTFAFGNGFSASLSIEDALFRQSQIIALRPTGGAVYTNYAGVKMPDLVANIRVDQGWGSAQLMGALHEVRTLRRGGDNQLGWAIGAGVVVNLPMLAEGDTLGLQAAYSDGAISYVAPNAWGPGNRTADAVVKRNGALELASSWAIAAGFQHFWTPNVSSGFGVSYLNVDQTTNRFSYQNWDVQGNVVFTPVAGLETGFELQYKMIDPEGRGRSTRDALTGTFRVQRSF